MDTSTIQLHPSWLDRLKDEFQKDYMVLIKQKLLDLKKNNIPFYQTPDGRESDLNTLLGELLPSDIVLVEGYKSEPIPKIEIHRKGMDHPPLYLTMPDIIAVATNTNLPDCPLPCLDLDQPDMICDFIIARLPA